MKRAHLFLFILVAGVLIAAGSPRRQTYESPLTPVADGEQLSVTSVAVSTLTVPSGATIAHIQAYDGNIRYSDDGTNPTSSTGLCLWSTLDMWYYGDLDTIGLIAESGTVEVNVLYYKP